VQVLFVTGEYPPDIGGVGDYTARLRAALHELGIDSEVLSGLHWDARALLALLHRAPKTGIVHIQYQPAAFDLLGDVCLMPSLLRLARPAVRVVTTLHDARVPYLFPFAGPLRWQAVRLLAATSHAIIAADERDLHAVGRSELQVPIGSNVPCSPPVDFDRAAFRARLGLSQDSLLVVFFGLLNASKGLDDLLDGFERVAEIRPDARMLVLGGEVGTSDVTDRATAAKLLPRLALLGNKLIRPGYLEPCQLSAYLLAADVALLPYADGASPRRGSLLACAEHGLPIVSTLPASSAVGEAVLAVPPGELAEAVLRISTDAALRERLRRAARELAEHSRWRRIAEQHQALYRHLC